ncbi:hypothetical protein [Solicola sp. PLA-1-18]
MEIKKFASDHAQTVEQVIDCMPAEIATELADEVMQVARESGA